MKPTHSQGLKSPGYIYIGDYIYVQQMTDLMAPVAPDAQETWSEGNVGFGSMSMHVSSQGINSKRYMNQVPSGD